MTSTDLLITESKTDFQKFVSFRLLDTETLNIVTQKRKEGVSTQARFLVDLNDSSERSPDTRLSKFSFVLYEGWEEEVLEDGEGCAFLWDEDFHPT